MMPDKLKSARSKIDFLDRRIAALLARRFALAVPLKALKKKTTDSAREKQVLSNAAAAAGEVYAPAAKAIFTEIIKQSKKLQKGTSAGHKP